MKLMGAMIPDKLSYLLEKLIREVISQYKGP